MKNVRALVLALPLLAFASSVSARQSLLALEATPTAIVPSSRYRQVVGVGLGGLAGVEFEPISPLALTGRAGYFQHLKRDGLSRTMVPVLGGVKLSSYGSSFYVAGESGLAYMRDKRTASGAPTTRSRQTTRAWGVGVGSAMARKDLRFSVHAWDANRMRNTLTFGVSLGFLILGE